MRPLTAADRTPEVGDVVVSTQVPNGRAFVVFKPCEGFIGDRMMGSIGMRSAEDENARCYQKALPYLAYIWRAGGGPITIEEN